MSDITALPVRRATDATSRHVLLFLPNARDVGALRTAFRDDETVAVTAVLPPAVSGDPADVTELARRAVDHLTPRLAAPLTVAGYCAAGSLAFEVARLLVDAAVSVRDVLLADCFFGVRSYPRVRLDELIDVPAPPGRRPAALQRAMEAFWEDQADASWSEPREVFEAGRAVIDPFFPELLTEARPVPARTRTTVSELYGASLQLSAAALFSTPAYLALPLTVVTSWSPMVDQSEVARRWQPLADSFRHVALDVAHDDLLRAPAFAALLSEASGDGSTGGPGLVDGPTMPA